MKNPVWGQHHQPWGWQDPQDIGSGPGAGSLQLTGRAALSSAAGEPGAEPALPWKCQSQFWCLWGPFEVPGREASLLRPLPHVVSWSMRHGQSGCPRGPAARCRERAGTRPACAERVGVLLQLGERQALRGP